MFACIEMRVCSGIFWGVKFAPDGNYRDNIIEVLEKSKGLNSLVI